MQHRASIGGTAAAPPRANVTAIRNGVSAAAGYRVCSRRASLRALPRRGPTHPPRIFFFLFGVRCPEEEVSPAARGGRLPRDRAEHDSARHPDSRERPSPGVSDQLTRFLITAQVEERQACTVARRMIEGRWRPTATDLQSSGHAKTLPSLGALGAPQGGDFGC